MSEVGQKFDQDKPRMDLLDSDAIEQLAMVLGFGAKKYAAHNWRAGISTSRLVAAALRHLFAYLRGENNDPESGLSHVAHAMCCCMFLLGRTEKAMDDRWRPAKVPPSGPLPPRTPIVGPVEAWRNGIAPFPLLPASSSPPEAPLRSPGSPTQSPSACVELADPYFRSE